MKNELMSEVGAVSQRSRLHRPCVLFDKVYLPVQGPFQILFIIVENWGGRLNIKRQREFNVVQSVKYVHIKKC